MPAKPHSRAVSTLPDSEKVAVNLGFVDLGQIDLLVREGFYSTRADFIRSAIRMQLRSHDEPLREATARKTLALGVHRFERAALEALVERGETLDVRVLGLASFAADVGPELARAAISSISVLGALDASPQVKAALADRMR